MKPKRWVIYYCICGWIAASIYLVYEAATKQLPWSVPALYPDFCLVDIFNVKAVARFEITAITNPKTEA